MKRCVFLVAPLAFVLGCSGGPPAPPSKPGAQAASDEVREARAKLSPEDRALAEAQDLCPVTGEKLGSMGTPVKVTVKGETVLLCCASCEKKALNEPDKTLAKANELKARRGGQGK